MTEAGRDRAPMVLVLAAFATVYLVWGSTYLAIAIAIETLPPFLMAGTRFLIAGALLYGWTRLRGAARPTRREWGPAAVVGGLLLLGGNGGVVWAEQYVASGVAALLVATVPFWMVLLEWTRRGGDRPGLGVVAGLLLGFGGIAVLVGPGEWAGGAIDGWGAAALVVASLSWAAGSIYSRGAALPKSPLVSTAMQMLTGGGLLVLVGLLAGEPFRWEPSAASWRSIGAMLYLIVFGSLVAFTAYVWLLRVSTPARVSTYAYVNPVVAVLLGWAVLGEPVTARVLVAVAVIVGAVIAITRRSPPRAATAAQAPRSMVEPRRPRRWSRRRAGHGGR